jgi:purine-nucleoside phosphorylase
MPTPHNSAQKGDYAEAVLLPGDPLRSKWIAETFLKDVKQVNAVRNCLGFTGTWNGKPVSVQATGMGQPSLSIYVHELINEYGLKTLIRVGTAGGLSEQVRVRDLILAQAASTDSGIVKNAFGPYNFAPIADFGLLRSAAEKAEAKGLRAVVGNMLSSDIFYHIEPGLEGYGRLLTHGVLGVEMESAALYTLAARFRARALTILTVSDHIVTGAHTTAEERQQTFATMIEIALAAAISDA